jgi:glutamate-1-semialdehyde aminotransferase
MFSRPNKPASPNQDWQDRANRVMAQNGSPGTNSKRTTQYIEGVYPTHISTGHGCYLYDPWNNRYIDFICGLGSISLGYGNNKVVEAVRKAVDGGVSHSLPSIQEVITAEKLQLVVPGLERMRFLKTGNEAAAAAIRIARAYTGKVKVFSRGYHGHHEMFTSLTPPASGVAGNFYIQKLGDDLGELESESNVAAVIVEAAELDMSEKWKLWLEKVRTACTQKGAVMIMDEIVTGFRVPDFTVSRYWDIKPDIILMGKGIANGLPLSVVGGKKDLMNAMDYFVSSTFSGETMGLAACSAVIDEMTTRCSLKDLFYYGERLKDKLNGLHSDITFQGYGTRAMLNTTNPTTALFMQEACKAGILFGKAWFYNFSHLEANLEKVLLTTCEEIIHRINRNEVKLQGKLPEEPVARRS